MPQNQDMIAALREVGNSPGPSTKDLRGLNPKLMLQAAEYLRRRKSNAADIAEAMGRQQTREARTGIQQEKLNLDKEKAQLNAILNAKKYKMKQKETEVLNEYRKTKTEDLKQKVNRYRIKNQAMEKMDETMIQTNAGEMSALKAMVLKESGYPIEGPETVEFEITDFDGNRNLVTFDPNTKEVSHTKLGKAPEDAGGGNLSQYETITGKVKDAEDSVFETLGASDLAGLDPKNQDVAKAANRLAQTNIREIVRSRGRDAITGTEAGTGAIQEVQSFEDDLGNLKSKNYEGRAALVKDLVPIIEKSMELEAKTGSRLFDTQRLAQEISDIYIVEEGDAMDVLKAAAQRAKGGK